MPVRAAVATAPTDTDGVGTGVGGTVSTGAGADGDDDDGESVIVARGVLPSQGLGVLDRGDVSGYRFRVRLSDRVAHLKQAIVVSVSCATRTALRPTQTAEAAAAVQLEIQSFACGYFYRRCTMNTR